MNRSAVLRCFAPFLIAVFSQVIMPVGAQEWKPANGPLKTRWANEVSPDNALPEYPRPQMVRKDWLSLNGLWNIRLGDGTETRILVPFAVESALSGVMKHFDRLTYNRSFEIPRSWQGQRVLIHFGAVDWETKVWVNGKELGVHRGGYDAFSFDITEALKAEARQEIKVEVFDPTDLGGQARGKQKLVPGSIMYTPTTGIWQTVWLEPVANAYIRSVRMIPDVDNGCLRITVDGTGTVEVAATDGGKKVASITGEGGRELKLGIPNAKLWSPGSPHLYDLRVVLKSGGKVVDVVNSYFGMRKIALGKDENGITRIMLNGKFVFQVGPLDQGFWPDGIYTAPTDEALKFDIEETKRLGFNVTRKHVKIEPERWYYWCDKLGLLVWQDMPCGNSYTDKPQPIDAPQFKTELLSMVRNHWNHPSIIMWVLFNESQGQHDTEALTAEVRSIDPSRLVDNASGNEDKNCGDVIDMHCYPGPDYPLPEENRAAVLGEFGGLGLPVDGHTWSTNAWGYEGTKNKEDLTRGYEKLLNKAWEFKNKAGLSAVIYTQLTDVETECNGLITYDRQVNKVIPERAAMANTGRQTDPFTGALVESGSVPRAEHPRPDLRRDNWMTLNGEWQFENDTAADGEDRGLIYGKDLQSKIMVPFCPESKLSGIGLGNALKLKDVWYRRTFEVPPAMKGRRVRLHFGGVDYKAWVYVNGQLAGSHTGENVAFNFEISRFLKEGANELVVKVLDDMWSGLQPCGKQCFDQSYSCFYTRTTGIWQSVWLEAVGSSFVENISVVPDPDNSRVLITAKINGNDKNLVLKAEAFAEGRLTGSDISMGTCQGNMVINLAEKKLWEPGSPFLYDLKFTLTSGTDSLDVLSSYFGLRKVTIEGRKILINGKPVFQRLILDQGFYPDGLWTAPTDESLRKDIEMSMACGYNGARLHQKVFEPRYLYWADKLGYLVWGEYPNAGYDNQKEGFSAVVNEWTSILLRDRNHPSVIGWCPFNENFENSGELQQMVWNVTKAVDPTRPALESSGWMHTLPNPEVRDAHDYTADPDRLRKKWFGYFSGAPEVPRAPDRYTGQKVSQADFGVPFMISEVGGIGWDTGDGWSYGTGPKTPDEFYVRYKGTVDAMLDNPNLFGFCYTQLTDIEQEKNGLYYYNRKPKFDIKKLYGITSRQAAYERSEADAPQPLRKVAEVKWKVIVGAVQDTKTCLPYRYAENKPAENWTAENFDDRLWKTGLAPFGHDSDKVRTDWASSDIYLRRTFEYEGGDLKNGGVVICHDEDTEVYVNGQKILSVSGYNGDYKLYLVTESLLKALKPGSNTLAVHTHQTGGGQYIDLAILVE